MPVIFFPNTQQQVIARGDRLGWMKKLLLWLGFPVDVRSAYNEDVWTLTKHHPPILQITEDEAMRRRAEGQARAEAEAKKNPNPGAKPRLYVPGGR